jgi:hypothetical protein
MDDCSIKEPAMHYETADGKYKTMPANPLICRFVWVHLNDVHRILHCLHCISVTVSAKKLFIVVSEVVILGHKYTYEGYMPNDSKTAKICNWPSCKNVTNI